MGQFSRSRKRASGVALFFVAFAALAIVPSTFVGAQSWSFDGTKGTKFDLVYRGQQGHAKFAVTKIGDKTDLPSSEATGIIPLGNFKAVALDAAGHPGTVGVGRFNGTINFKVELSKEVVDELKSRGVVNPFLYFWDPNTNSWVNVDSTKEFGDYSFGNFNRVRRPSKGTIQLTVQIKSWPASDPACGAGG